jgi:DNA replication and repair protein RecF
MYLAHLRLRDFRNYPRLDIDFAPGFHFLCGNNAQGKTNLLEAIYLLATLRSFRGVGNAQMIRCGQKGYFVGAKVVGQSPQEIRMYWSVHERKLALNGQSVRRTTDYLGVLRAVVFCSEDLQLVKGPARIRRRFMDLLLSQAHPDYLPLLQRYAQSLRARNALLKNPAPDVSTLDSFTQELVQLGTRIMRHRCQLAPRLELLTRQSYSRIAGPHEELRLAYQPSVQQDMAVELAQARARERLYRTTLIGPHRDDLLLLTGHQLATQFASEGQKRTLAIALKMAQAEYWRELHGAPPVLLIDDVMGELDARRRHGFLPLLEETHQGQSQVFMTGTEESWPPQWGPNLHRWKVDQGTIGVSPGN